MNQQPPVKYLIKSTAIFLLLLQFGCATAPLDFPRENSVFIADTANTDLGREVDEWAAANPGMSGYFPLIKGLDALGVRLALMDRAERTIDAQYFLIKNLQNISSLSAN